MTTLQTAVPRDGVAARGIGFAVLSYASFSTADAIIKLSSARFSVFQIAFTVAFFALLPVLGLTIGRGGLRALVPQSWPLVALRGAFTAVGGLLAWQGFAMLPLSEVYAILFAAPILVTVMSVVILREEVGWRRWLAQAVGFAGVLVMIRPDFATLGLGHLLTALAAILGASALITLRKIGGRETSAAILFAVCLAIMAVSAPMVPSAFVLPEWRELGLLALAGLLMGCGHGGLVLATREAPAVVVAPFQYSQMIWGVLFGVLLFADRPEPVLFLGMAIVVASGLYTIWRETARQRPVTLGGGRGEVPARAAR